LLHCFSLPRLLMSRTYPNYAVLVWYVQTTTANQYQLNKFRKFLHSSSYLDMCLYYKDAQHLFSIPSEGKVANSVMHSATLLAFSEHWLLWARREYGLANIAVFHLSPCKERRSKVAT
jgi:hypothetical protein